MEKKYIIDNSTIEYIKSKDPLLSSVVEKIRDLNIVVEKDPFKSLVSSVISQQLSLKAAKNIWDRFQLVFPILTPEIILKAEDNKIKSCGLSDNKVKYIKNIALAFASVHANTKWEKLSDEQVEKELIKIKGIGKWTVKMFLIFCLERENISSYDDLGLKKGVMKLYGLTDLPSKEVFSKIMDKFDPHKTAASLYFWKITTRENFIVNNQIKYLMRDCKNGLGYYFSPLGWIKIVVKNNLLVLLTFCTIPFNKEIKVNKEVQKVINQLNEYFKGERKSFSINYELKGTAFQLKVWKELLNIPYGTTITYKDLAKRTGNINASRAVGGANNKNKIPIIIPCHRVVGKDGSLTGYSGGINIKEKLLLLESKKKPPII